MLVRVFQWLSNELYSQYLCHWKFNCMIKLMSVPRTFPWSLWNSLTSPGEWSPCKHCQHWPHMACPLLMASGWVVAGNESAVLSSVVSCCLKNSGCSIVSVGDPTSPWPPESKCVCNTPPHLRLVAMFIFQCRLSLVDDNLMVNVLCASVVYGALTVDTDINNGRVQQGT